MTELYIAQKTSRPVSIPAGLGWDTTNFPLTPSLVETWGNPVALTAETAESMFDLIATARSAPGATYYVSMSGSDANNGTSSGTPYQSIWKAQQSANSGGVPAKIYVAAGTYPRSNGFNNSNAVIPSVDTAYVATGGRVITGPFELFSAPSTDATYTNTYSWARTNVNKVLDMANLDRFGNYTELQFVATPAICNITPNSWTQAAGIVYVRRNDGVAVTNTNTRVLLGTVSGFLNNNVALNFYFGNEDNYSGFDIEGGNTAGVMSLTMNSVPASKKIAVAKACSFKYGGGQISNGGVRGVAIDNWHGLCAFFNCRADANDTDGFNMHHSTANAAAVAMLTVNCSGFNNGRTPQTSNNGWTSHEDTVGIDLAGYYVNNNGGTCRSVNSSKSLLAGTLARADMGDKQWAGSLPPTAFQVDDTSTYWLDGVQIDMPAGTAGLRTAAAGATINTRNMWATRATQSGLGTIAAY